MFEVIYMKADYEPWWGFPGWEDYIIEKQTFDVEESAREYLRGRLIEFREKYPFEKMKGDTFWAFWSVKEQCFCDSCDDDVQIYHGLIWNEIK